MQSETETMESKYPKGMLAGKLVLLNAPPGAGKDTIANRVVELTGCHKGQFKDHLYVATAVLFNVSLNEFVKVATDTELKEKPCKALGNISPRQALITVSEKMIKPAFGKSYFGNVEANKLGFRAEKGVVYADCGFIDEVAPLVRIMGPENTYLIKFTRKGHTDFEGDSRDWLPAIEGAKTFRTGNNKTVDNAVGHILDFILREGESLR